jgi:hypothetical protein
MLARSPPYVFHSIIEPALARCAWLPALIPASTSTIASTVAVLTPVLPDPDVCSEWSAPSKRGETVTRKDAIISRLKSEGRDVAAEL